MSRDTGAGSDAREALTYHPSKVEWATAQFLAVPPSFLARLGLYLIILTIVAGLIYTATARIAVTVGAPGILRPEAGVLPIRAPVTMNVKELHVRENDVVQQNQLLVVSQDYLSEEEAQRLVSDAATLSAILEKDKSYGCGECVASLERLAGTAFIIQGSGPIREPLSALRQRLREHTSLRSLYSRRGGSAVALQRRIELAREKLAEIKKRNAEAMLATKVEELTNDIVTAQAQMAEREDANKSTVDSARDRLVIQLAEIDDVVERYRAQQTIVAPVAGTITDLQLGGPGQLVSAGQHILDIVPIDARLAAELRVANKDISKVRVGMEVRMKLAALPEREFGVATGKVESVAANVSYDSSRPGASNLPVYKVVVKLDQQSLSKDGKPYDFKLGMGLEGLVVAGYEPMLALAVKRILNLKDSLE